MVFSMSGVAIASSFLSECLSSQNRKSVSSPRHIAPSVRISLAECTCLLLAKS
jgi:hypothetical protein